MKIRCACLLAIFSALTFSPASVYANPSNSADFSGGVAIGTSYAGIATAPTNGAIIQGSVGIGTTNPVYVLDVGGGTGQQIIRINGGNSGINNGTALFFGNAGTNTTAIGDYSAIIGGASYNTALTLYTGGQNIIVPNGNVGIGTTAPSLGILQVHPATNENFVVHNVASNLALGGINDADSAYVSTYIDSYPLVLNSQSGGVVDIATTSGSNTLNVNGTGYFSGNVGIGTTAPAHLLHVGSSSASGIVAELQNSSGACTHSPGASSETVACSSDMRLKSDIKDSKSALSWLDDMRIRDFTVKATGEHKTGVVAQEIILNHPDMVHKDAVGIYSVDEPNPWVLVKTIQELHGIVLKQQGEIAELKQTVEQLTQQK